MENIPEDLKAEIIKEARPKIEVILGKNLYVLYKRNQPILFQSDNDLQTLKLFDYYPK